MLVDLLWSQILDSKVTHNSIANLKNVLHSYVFGIFS
jgi:hypothetical protein